MSRPGFGCVFRCTSCLQTWDGFLRASFTELDPVRLAAEVAAWEKDPHEWQTCPHCGAKVDGAEAMVPDSEDMTAAELRMQEEHERLRLELIRHGADLRRLAWQEYDRLTNEVNKPGLTYWQRRRLRRVRDRAQLEVDRLSRAQSLGGWGEWARDPEPPRL